MGSAKLEAGKARQNISGPRNPANDKKLGENLYSRSKQHSKQINNRKQTHTRLATDYVMSTFQHAKGPTTPRTSNGSQTQRAHNEDPLLWQCAFGIVGTAKGNQHSARMPCHTRFSDARQNRAPPSEIVPHRAGNENEARCASHINTWPTRHYNTSDLAALEVLPFDGERASINKERKRQTLKTPQSPIVCPIRCCSQRASGEVPDPGADASLRLLRPTPLRRVMGCPQRPS